MLRCRYCWCVLVLLHTIDGFVKLTLPSACERFSAPGTFVESQGEGTDLSCKWNGADAVETFTWTHNGEPFIPSSISNNKVNEQNANIARLDSSHSGNYTCTIFTVTKATSMATITIELQGVPVIVMEPSDAVLGGNVTLACVYSRTNIENEKIDWFADGNSLRGQNRYSDRFHGTPDGQKLTISNVNADVADDYTCRTENELKCLGRGNSMYRVEMQKLSDAVALVIRYPLKLKLSTTKETLTLRSQETYNIDCDVVEGDTPYEITWYKDNVPVSDIVQVIQVIPNSKTLRIYKAKEYMSGHYECRGHNDFGSDSKSFKLNVTDDNINVIKKTSEIPGVGSEARLMCYDSNINMDLEQVSWYKEDVILSDPHERYLYNENKFRIPVLRREDKGRYKCRYQAIGSPVIFRSKAYTLDVIDLPPKPVNLTVLEQNITENSLIVTWQFEEQDTNATEIQIVAKNSKPEEGEEESGFQYRHECINSKCPIKQKLPGLKPGTLYEVRVTAINSYGTSESDTVRATTDVSKYTQENIPEDYLSIIIGVVAGCMAMFALLGFLIFRHHKKDYKKKVYDKIERELGYTITKSTHKPDPYEYCYTKLQFKGTLGEGAFGKVIKAEAPGLKCPQGSQIVAVKLARDSETDYERQELLDEINILAKLGVHQHIIPLLGTCTAPGKPTCLITQYMPDGDLQNYLRTSRPSFVGTYPFRPNSADSFQPVHNINNVSNLCTSDDALTSKDLISFARQISCGMEYVASQKIVHRDLAARNVLVASKRSLKITDFGLAREMRGANEEYVMGPNRKVPYRWLAPESFFDKKFTVYSDVWAYGVLLYEILTLGGSPYPGHTIRDIPAMLKQKYRMSPPRNSKPELNHLMTQCWNEHPESRPSFTQIKNLLDELLGDRPEDYLDCGDPDADFLPNINSDDNKDMEKMFRYSFLSRNDPSSIRVQGYDRIADAHSAYSTLTTGANSDTLKFSEETPMMNEIKSNPIPDTYQHLPVKQPSPDPSVSSMERKNSAQYMNHEMGQLPVLVQADFVCGTENFITQKL